MPESHISSEMRDAALRGLCERRATRPQPVDQSSLSAGEPITFYCELCGWISDIMPEGYFLSQPRRCCSECTQLVLLIEDVSWPKTDAEVGPFGRFGSIGMRNIIRDRESNHQGRTSG